ncbi:unnamed protein product [Brachionus calyciflorus]|uniref:Uncharacterized protein n=1 Tax=Brachionus calyciflorus TaxID=104777 RepID=A0A813RKR4_9BILA|nr:unnamed protein product [Brachionus calyciflorus]
MSKPNRFFGPSENFKYVLMATNIDEKDNKFYYFYLPFCAEAWKKLGFKTVILLISTKEVDLENLKIDNQPAMKTIEYLKKLDCKLIVIKSDKNYGKITSMVSRLFAGAITELNDEDYIMTSDSDLIPISKSYYNTESHDAITVWNAFCCGSYQLKNKNYEMYPMGHIGMKKKHWREVMNFNKETKINSESVRILVGDNMGNHLFKEDDKIARGDPTWFADQTILSKQISIYVNELNRTELIKKKFTGIRYDRIYSDSELIKLANDSYDQLTDFHAFHSDFSEKWPIMENLFKRLFDNITFNSLLGYFKDFKNS